MFMLIKTTNHIDRAFKEVSRMSNIIGCFEHNRDLDKNFFFIVNFINQFFDNCSLEPILSITQFKVSHRKFECLPYFCVNSIILYF